ALAPAIRLLSWLSVFLFKQPIDGHLWTASFKFCPPTTIPLLGMRQVPIRIIFLEEERTGGI
ncbi:hypothetical protein LEMLEM_LOCUS21677, partial [Lemmus lemmus]